MRGVSNKHCLLTFFIQSAEAETTYKACVAEANNRQHVLLKVKSELLAAVREQILFSDQCIKKVSEKADIITYLKIKRTSKQVLCQTVKTQKKCCIMHFLQKSNLQG